MKYRIFNKANGHIVETFTLCCNNRLKDISSFYSHSMLYFIEELDEKTNEWINEQNLHEFLKVDQAHLS